MANKLVKIFVTSDQLAIPENTDLGLSTKYGDEIVAQGIGVRTSPGHFRLKSDWTVSRNMVFWIDETKVPKSGARIVSMPRGYLEENPLDVKKRQDFLDREKRENETRAIEHNKRKAAR